MTIADARTRWIALIVLCMGTLMIVLDTTIVNVALPSIREDLGFSETSLAWVVNAYLLTFGGFLLLGGRLGDLLGHRRLFLMGITLFTLASLACGLSTTQGFLVGARAVQGLGGAVTSAVSLSLIMTLFTDVAERTKAMGVYGFVAAGGGSVGVLLGGILTDVLSWHWIFLVNVPIGAAVFMLSLRILPGARGPATSQRVDVAGAVSVTASLMLAVYAIVNGNQVGWVTARALPAAERRDCERRRSALGCRDVRLVLPLGALFAAGARLQAAPGRPGLPTCVSDHGCLLGRPVREAGHALRGPAPDGERPCARLDRACTPGACTGRW
jgi:MFS family permease